MNSLIDLLTLIAGSCIGVLIAWAILRRIDLPIDNNSYMDAYRNWLRDHKRKMKIESAIDQKAESQ